MKKILTVLIIVFGINACSENPELEKKDSANSCSNKSLNPNGDSELSILMREFAAYSDSVKTDLLNQKEPRAKPENLAAMLSAKKTDENIDKNIFVPFAQSYIANVEYLYTAKPEDRVNAYNSMINACISCHHQFCGGPIKRIQKLLIPTK